MNEGNMEQSGTRRRKARRWDIVPETMPSDTQNEVITNPLVENIVSNPDGQAFADFLINDCQHRGLLTRKTAHVQLQSATNTAAVVRGRYLPDSKTSTAADRALHLSLTAPSMSHLFKAVQWIEKVIESGSTYNAAEVIKPVSVSPDPTKPAGPESLNQPMTISVPVPISRKDAERRKFVLVEKLLGPGSSFIKHIEEQSHAEVQLYGVNKPLAVQLSFEIKGISTAVHEAKKMVDDLIETVSVSFRSANSVLATPPARHPVGYPPAPPPHMYGVPPPMGMYPPIPPPGYGMMPPVMAYPQGMYPGQMVIPPVYPPPPTMAPIPPTQPNEVPQFPQRQGRQPASVDVEPPQKRSKPATLAPEDEAFEAFKRDMQTERNPNPAPFVSNVSNVRESPKYDQYLKQHLDDNANLRRRHSMQKSILKSVTYNQRTNSQNVKFRTRIAIRSESGTESEADLGAGSDALHTVEYSKKQDHEHDECIEEESEDNSESGSIIEAGANVENEEDGDKSHVAGDEEEPEIMKTMIRKISNATVRMPSLYTGIDLRERRIQMLNDLKEKREKKRLGSVNGPVDVVVTSSEQEIIVTSPHALSTLATKHEVSTDCENPLQFLDDSDLGLSNDNDIAEIRAFVCPNTGKLIGIHSLYRCQDACVTGNFYGSCKPKSHTGNIVCRVLEHIIRFSAFTDKGRVVGVSIETSERRETSFGLCSENYERSTHICSQGDHTRNVTTWDGYCGKMVGLSGRYKDDEIYELVPHFTSWSNVTFMAHCLLRQTGYPNPSENDRNLIGLFARARIQIGIPICIPNWIADADRSSCADCATMFSMWRRQIHCSSCGEIFCAHCCREGRPSSPLMHCIASRKQVLQPLCTTCRRKNVDAWELVSQYNEVD